LHLPSGKKSSSQRSPPAPSHYYAQNIKVKVAIGMPLSDNSLNRPEECKMHPLLRQKRATWCGILTSIRWHPTPLELKSNPHQKTKQIIHSELSNMRGEIACERFHREIRKSSILQPSPGGGWKTLNSFAHCTPKCSVVLALECSVSC